MMQSIHYSELGPSAFQYSRLYLDYVANAPGIQPFLGRHYKDAKAWSSILDRLSTRELDRSDLVKVLSTQNRAFQCGVRTLANIDLLLNDNTVAVVTGQQLGLFTGPMYTLFKVITAISLCERLGQAHPDHAFVPVFWLEGEDHDFEEVAATGLITAANEYAPLRYQPPERKDDRHAGSVGPMVLSDSIREYLAQVETTLQPTDFTPAVMELLRVAYSPGMTLTRAFVHMLNVLLEDSGLVLLDPTDREIKRMLRPVFRRELDEVSASCQLVIDRSQELEERYHAQVKPRPVNAFLHHKEGRYPIEPHPDGFALKGSRKHFSRDEMLSLLDERPEVFSPNVVLRPICQDSLLPTAAYVAGPSEVAYFAQIMPLYKAYDIPPPIIYPRASATLIEEKVEKVFARFEITPLDLFVNMEGIKARVAQQVSDFKADELFAGTMGSIDEALNSLRTGITAIDQTLAGTLDNTLSKVSSQVEVLKQKTIAAQKRQHDVYLRQIDKAAVYLTPGGAPQERALSVVYFLNKYGLEFVRWLRGELRTDLHKHQLIRF